MSDKCLQKADVIEAFQRFVRMAKDLSHLNMRIISTLDSLHRLRMKLYSRSFLLLYEDVKNEDKKKNEQVKNEEKTKIVIDEKSKVIKKRKRPRVWSNVDGNVCPWRTFYDETDNDDEWRQLLRMSKSSFMKLCELLRPYVGKKRTNMRMPISVEKRIGITLHYLSNDDKYSSTAKFFGVGKTSVCKVFRKVCAAITDHLANTFIKEPQTSSDIELLCEDFYSTLGVPQTVGVLNFNHVFIRRPNTESDLYLNKKSRYSIKVLSAVNSKHQFTDVNADFPGSMSDADVFTRSGFEDSLNCEDSHHKLLGDTPVPYGFIGNHALPLSTFVRKKYPIRGMEGLSPEELCFNRAMENGETLAEVAVGRLKARWGVLRSDMDVNLPELPCIIKACYILHNFCEKSGEVCDEQQVHEVIWQDRIDQPPSQVLPLRQDKESGKTVRLALSNYLSTNHV